MKMTVKKQIGNKEYEFSFEGTNLHEVVLESEKLSFPSVFKCGLCESEALSLKAYTTQQGYEYTKIVCHKCGASVTFGQRRDNKDQFFLRKDDNGRLDWQEKPQQDQKAPANSPNPTRSKVRPPKTSEPDDEFSYAGEDAPF